MCRSGRSRARRLRPRSARGWSPAKPWSRSGFKAPGRIRRPLPYLQQAQPNNYDLQLDVALRAASMNEAVNICHTNFKYMYWSSVQQLVHHASSGCAMNVGDLLGSGTISGPEKSQRGSLLEISWNGTEPIDLSTASSEHFLKTAIRWSCAAGARATAIASVLARSKGRSCRRDDSLRHCERERSNPSSREESMDCFVAEPVIGRAFARPVGSSQ